MTQAPVSDPTPSGYEGSPVLLFDGECGLCQRIVRVLLRCDRRGELRFAPLQGPAAQGYLRSHGLPTADFDSLVFVPDWSRPDRGDHRLRTDGAVAALRAAGGPRWVIGLISAWPPAWRDGAYRLIARWRYRIFGRSRAGVLDRPEWRGRFL
jgi:predicted DCC family thiol-disulfide oxidoreductase YuxK